MKITDVFTPQMETLDVADSMILEAARFGRREAGVVMRNSDRFKIGIEYEFDVTEGESAVEDEIDRVLGSVSESELNKFVLSSVEDIEAIVNDPEVYSYADEAKDAKNGSEEDIDSFFQFFYGDAKMRVENYRNILRRAKEAGDIRDIPKSVWQGRGFPSTVNAPKPIRLPELEDASYDEVVATFGTEQNAKFFLDALQAELTAVEKYLERDCDKIENATVNEIINGMSEAIVKHRETRQDRNKVEKRTKVDVVKESLPVSSSLIAGVVPDVTVPNGVEVVTKPLDLRQTFQVMSDMFDYIDMVGGTSKSTGLHVNLSVKDFSEQNFNAVKAVVLLDPDAYQTGRKYPMRDKQFVDSIFKILRREDILANLAKSYVNGGDRVLIKRFEKLMKITSEKMRSVNLAHFFDEETTIRDRRIEFRFVGGKNYHTRLSEITNDIGHMCYVMLAGSDEDFLKREYYRAVIRLLDRAVKATVGAGVDQFTDLVDIVKRNM